MEAPIVLLDAKPECGDAPPIAAAPGLKVFGFMFPYTPLHHLILQSIDFPLVMTSGNQSDVPQCIDNNDAREQLDGIADYWLLHDRDIRNRVDDSVARVVGGEPRLLRRARGFAPASLPLPPGFEPPSGLLALGGELKNTFCMVKGGQAILSQHMGDLENTSTYIDYEKNLKLYKLLFDHQPGALVIDAHPEYLSSKLGRQLAEAEDLPLMEVQHHHAHMAACLAENAWPLDGRNFPQSLPILNCVRFWKTNHSPSSTPCWTGKSTAPLASSAGRLFDAVAGAVGLCRDKVFYEGQAAIEFEALVNRECLDEQEKQAYPFHIATAAGEELPFIDPTEMWHMLFCDLQQNTPVEIIAARFHLGLAAGISKMVNHLCHEGGARHIETVALSGGVFQNRVLFERVRKLLENDAYRVLSHSRVPANDGGVALGQAVVALARMIQP